MYAKSLGLGAPTGWMLFIVVVVAQTVMVTLVGVSWFASAVTEEKEEGMLGLLQMTNLNPLSILLGKSTSRLGSALLLVLAQFPFTLLAITLGGVSMGQVLAAYWTLAAYTFFLCNVALLWSVLLPKTASATACTLVTLVVFLSSGPLLYELWEETSGVGWLAALLESLAVKVDTASPIKRLIEIGRTGYSGAPMGWQVWSNFALGLLSFLLAWAAFPWFANRSAEAGGGSGRRFLGRWRRPARAWKNALAWKDFHFSSGGKLGLGLRIVLFGTLIAGILGLISNLPRDLFSMIAWLGFVLELAIVASRIVKMEVHEQTWSSLALLPMTIPQITRRKLLGSLLAILPAACAVLAAFGMEFWPSDLSLSHMLANTAGMVFGFVAVLFAAYLVAFLSLRVKRAALALGLIGAYVCTGVFNAVAHILVRLLSFVVTAGGHNQDDFGSDYYWLVSVASQAVCAVLFLGVIYFLRRATFRHAEILASEN
jgi:hypothetical protein